MIGRFFFNVKTCQHDHGILSDVCRLISETPLSAPDPSPADIFADRFHYTETVIPSLNVRFGENFSGHAFARARIFKGSQGLCILIDGAGGRNRTGTPNLGTRF